MKSVHPKVSAAFRLKQGTHSLRRILHVIDISHTDGALPSIAVRALPAGSMIGAIYTYSHLTPIAVQVAQPCDAHEFSFVHEIGHILDHHSLNLHSGFATKAADLNDLRYWKHAVMSTSEIRSLQQLQGGPTALASAFNLLDIREIWARTYVQWIAQRSKDAKLNSELRRRAASPNFLTRLSQWEAGHFAAISREIDVLFQRRGWI